MTFLEQKNNVAKYFAQCADFARNYGFEGYVEAIEACGRRVEGDWLTFVALGEARRGKSSMLAAYLEDPGLFPVDVEVTTRLASVVRYGETEKITVAFEDGTEKEIAREEIADYASELLRKSNEKKARLITIETPNPKLGDGVSFVDTPSVGSLNPAHTAATYGFLPEADVALFVSHAGAELTSPELSFLRSVREHCENFLFVLTMIDMSEDYERVIERNIELIEKHAWIPRAAIRYVPVSARNRLDGLRDGDEYLREAGNFDALEEAIGSVIEEKRAPPMGALEGILISIAKEIQIRETGLASSEREKQELTAKLKKLQAERASLLDSNVQWRNELQYKITQIGMKRSNRFTTFIDEANALMNALIEDEEYLKVPSSIVHEIERLAQITAHELYSGVFDELYTVELEFQKNVGLGLYDSAVSGGLAESVPTPSIGVLRVLKPSKLRALRVDKVILPFWPISLVLREQPEMAWWDKLDEKRKAYRTLEEHGPKHIPAIKAEVSEYITMCVSTWRGEHSEFMNTVQHRFLSGLDRAIRQSKETIDRDLAELGETMKKDDAVRARELGEANAAKTAFAALVGGLRALRQSAKAPETVSAASQGGEAYSHLEE